MPATFDRLKTVLADRYAIERELGAGGMATVYLAEDVKHHRKVAVKVLRPELAATLGPERFVREIEIAAGLTHPHILPLFDSGEAGGFLYYVMPYIEGESLRDRLDREGKLSVENGIRLADQVASALSYAHEQGVVHRDIKPENILLAGDQAVVADFGIARAVQVAGGEKLTGTGLVIGTPAYMSPEQALGQEDVDGRSDVYALGCVVYETVSGHTPFEGGTAQALLAKHAADTAPGLRTRDPAIPVFVERAVGKALAKNPAHRFQSANTFAEALTSGTVVARVGPRRRRRRTVVGAATAVVLLLAAGAWWLATMGGGPAIERLAVLPFGSLMNDPEQEWLVQGTFDALISELGQAGVTVIGRTSVMRYQNTDRPIREIARELDVDAVIEGSVFLAGDSVGIQVRLVDGETEAQLWSQSYDADVRNVLALYRDVTRAIANEIQLALTPQVEARLAGARPVNPEAYEAYLKGQFHLGRQSSADLEAALQYFELALEKDPNYALAYVGISGVWGSRQVYGIVPPHEGRPRARAAALKALQLDSTLAEAHQRLATIRMLQEWDWEGAEAAYRRVIQLNPNYPRARAHLSHLLEILGRPDEAGVQIERALELDPFNEMFKGFNGWHLIVAQRYDEAIAQFQNALKTAPNSVFLHSGLLNAFYAQGRHDEALAEWKTFFFTSSERGLAEAMERGYAEGGLREAARRAAEMWEARADTVYVPPVGLANLFAASGERDRALDWLERGFEARAPNMPGIGATTILRSVRDDPRFQDLLRRMNLPG